MGVTRTNLIMGPASLYIAATGATEPTDLTTAWAVAWRNLGATDGGITIEVVEAWAKLSADQIADVPGRRLISREVFVNTSMAEPTLDNFAAALNEPTPAAAVSGVRTFEPTNGLAALNPAEKAVGFEGQAPGGYKRRIVLRSCLSIEGTKELSKKDGQKLFAVKWAAHFVSDSIAPFVYLDGTA